MTDHKFAAVCYNPASSRGEKHGHHNDHTEHQPHPLSKRKPLNLTATAIAKVKEIMAQQNPVPAGLRVGVVGGGCSGFSYSMSFENGAGMMDKTFDFDGLKVYVDATSLMYLKGVQRRLHRNPRRRWLQVRQSEREEHLRLRIFLQRLAALAANLGALSSTTGLCWQRLVCANKPL